MEILHTFCRTAFFSNKDADCKRQFEGALQKSINWPSLKCCATNTQLSAYLMYKYEEFATKCGGEPKYYVAVRYLGLQDTKDCDNAKKVWVLNNLMHFTEDGKLLDPEDSPFIWLGSFKRGRPELSNLIPDNTFAATVMGKLSKKKALQSLVNSLKTVYADNFPATILTLGAQIMSVHYEILNDKGYNVPAAILCGDISQGKSTATKAALSMIGTQNSHFLTSVSDNKSYKLTSTTTMGIVIDDPSDVKEISEKILIHFERGTATSCKFSYKPRCTFITSVNQECLNKLASLPPRLMRYMYSETSLYKGLFKF